MTTYLLVAAVAAVIIAGAALAALTRRIHPSLSFKTNWLYFSLLLALITVAVFAITFC